MHDATGGQQMALPSAEAGPGFPANLANLLIELLAREGISRESVLRLELFDETKLDDADAMYSSEEYIELMLRAIELTNNPILALDLGAMINVSTYADLGLFAMTAPRIVDAFRETEPFIRQQFPFIELDVLPEADAFKIRFIEQRQTEYDRFKLDLVMGCIGSITKFLCGGHFPVREVHFRFAEPACSQDYVKFFDCPVIWNASYHQLVCEPAQANWQVIFADKLNHAKARIALERKMPGDKNREPGQHQLMVNDLIFDGLPEILPLDAIAQKLNMSVRTLTRNLKKQQTSYREILDQVRKSYAHELFEKGATIQQVAGNLGYKDSAAFSRAFNRWYQQNPGAYLKKMTNKN